jgi:hypothetical protein
MCVRARLLCLYLGLKVRTRTTQKVTVQMKQKTIMRIDRDSHPTHKVTVQMKQKTIMIDRSINIDQYDRSARVATSTCPSWAPLALDAAHWRTAIGIDRSPIVCCVWSPPLAHGCDEVRKYNRAEVRPTDRNRNQIRI